MPNNGTTQHGTTQHGTTHGNNDYRYSDLLEAARKLGGEAAAGGDALPKLALHLVRAAADGYVSLDKDPDTKKDDAARIYEAYANEYSTKGIHNHTPAGVRANISKARQFIILGLMTTCDPVGLMNRAPGILKDMNNEGLKPQSAYPAYLSVARAQIAMGESTTPRDLTEDEIREAMAKPEPKDKDVTTEVTRAKKILEKLISGEKGVKCQDEEIENAFHTLQDWLNGSPPPVDEATFAIAASEIVAAGDKMPVTLQDAQPVNQLAA